MLQKLKPKERMLAAMTGEPTDYLPCSIYFNTNLTVPGYDLTRWKDHVRLQIDLGLDPVLYLHIPHSHHPRLSVNAHVHDNPEITTHLWSPDGPDVRTRTWIEEVDTEKYPVLFKEYRTPAGTLRHGVRYTPDWPHGEDIPWDDYSASNVYEPLVKTPEDVDAFSYVWAAPTEEEAARAAGLYAELQHCSEQSGAPIQGYGGRGLATLIAVMGAENAIMFAVDHPEAFKRLAEIDTRANVERIRLCARAGADFIKRFGGYEQTNFFSPAIFRDVVLPLLKEEVRVAHQEGVPIYYRVVTGMEPLLDSIAGAGFDCIEGGEPHLSQCSLEMWRDAFRGKASSWTGVSSPRLLGGGDERAVREEVRRCVDVFGRRSFILGVTNSIRNHFLWENTLALVDEWKKIR